LSAGGGGVSRGNPGRGTGGVRSHGGNTALIAGVSGHHDVALESPRRSPGVLHQPVGLAGGCSVTNGEDTVVELSSRASWLVVDTSAVELEGRVGSINGNRDGADGRNSGLELGFRS